MNEQTIQLSLFVVFYVKFVAFLPLITIKSSLKLLDSDRLETRTKLSSSLFSVTLFQLVNWLRKLFLSALTVMLPEYTHAGQEHTS